MPGQEWITKIMINVIFSTKRHLPHRHQVLYRREVYKYNEHTDSNQIFQDHRYDWVVRGGN